MVRVSSSRLLSLSIAWLAVAQPCAAQDTGGPEAATALLEKILETYRAAPVIEDTIHIESSMGGVPDPVEDRVVLLGPDGQSLLTTSINELISTKDTYYVTSARVKDRYVETPMRSDPLRTLRALGSPQLFIPYALRYAEDRGEILRTLAFGIPGELNPSSVREVRGADGGPMLQATFVNEQGYLRIDVDPDRMLLREAFSDYAPTDAPVGNFHILGKATFATRIHDALPRPIEFNPAGRTKVDSFAAMLGQTTRAGDGAPTITVGAPAPAFELYTLEGEKFDSRAAADTILVLDFWASWCAPCRQTLTEVGKVAAWAAESEPRVKVVPINTLEINEEIGARWEKAHEYWEDLDLGFASLFDMDGSVAGAYGVTRLPATIVVGPDGTVAAVYTGTEESRATAIRKLIARLLGP